MNQSDIMKGEPSVRQSNNLQLRHKSKEGHRRPNKSKAQDEFEKMFGKDIDEFLEDSEWDLNSLDNMSNLSSQRSNVRSALGDGRIRGLESIYLQRIETSQKKRGGFQSKGVTSRKKPKFRVMQDRFVDDPS